MPIILFGDGHLRRTFTHVMDICHQVVEASDHHKSSGECFNIAGENYSLSEVASLIATKFGVPIKFTKWPDVDFKLESGDTVFDTIKIRTLLPKPINFSVESWISEK